MGNLNTGSRSRPDPSIRLISDSVNMSINNVVGTTNYEELENKPAIEGNTLIGDKTLEQLGITKENMDITAESLGINADSLGINAGSLGIDAESLGLSTAGAYSVYSLFT